jgi:HEAT repeat protein
MAPVECCFMSDEPIQIFLASPSDVTLHRKYARDIVGDVDRNIAEPLGTRVKLIGWEDLRPGFGRPQGLINPAIDRCNVFVGVLGKRWGQPTGAASSGFQEEYDRVVERINEGYSVALWIYVVALSDEDRGDAGPQLTQVITFRDRLYRTALVREFTSPEHFAMQLQADLSGLVVETRPEALPQGPEEPRRETKPVEQSDVLPSRSGDEATAQVSGLLNALANAERASGGSPESLDAFYIVRLHLLSVTWMSTLQAHTVLGVHEINLLYSYRDRLKLQPAESDVVLRTMCEHAPVAPGWGVIDSDDASNRLLRLAATDGQPSVRAGAIDLIDFDTLLDLTPTAEGTETLPRWLDYLINHSDDTAVRASLIAMLRRAKKPEALEALRTLAKPDAPGTDDAVRALVAALIANQEFDEAFSLADSRLPALDRESQDLVAEAAGSIDSSIFQNLLTGHKVDLRTMSTRILASRGELEEAVCRRLLDDQSLEVRVVAFEALCAQGASVDDSLFAEQIKGKAEQIKLGDTTGLVTRAQRALLGTRAFAELVQRLSWIWLGTGDEYAVLAERHFDRFGGRVRRDLADAFEVFREESIEKLRDEIVKQVEPGIEADVLAELGECAPQDISERVNSTMRRTVEENVTKLTGEEKYQRMVFGRAALKGIGLNGNSGDAGLVRGWLTDDNALIREAASEALARLGDNSDVERLIVAASTMYGDARQSVAEAAIRLDKGAGLATTLLLSGSDDLAALAAWRIADDAVESAEDIVLRLLNHNAAEVRRAGMYHACQRLDSDELGALLAQYQEQERWYYDVVWQLDQLLYGPEFLKRRRRRELIRAHDESDRDRSSGAPVD